MEGIIAVPAIPLTALLLLLCIPRAWRTFAWRSLVFAVACASVALAAEKTHGVRFPDATHVAIDFLAFLWVSEVVAFVAAALWWSWRESKLITAVLGTCVVVFLGAIARDELGKARLQYTHVEGIVRAAESGAPIAGARVLVIWETEPGGYARNACTWVAAAETDGQGRYRVHVDAAKMKGVNEVTKQEMEGGYPAVRIYKAGRQLTRSDRIDSDAREVRNRLGPFARFAGPAEVTIRHHDTMAVAQGESSERMKTLLALSHPEPGCRTYDGIDSIRAYFDAIATEARAIASSEDDQAYARIIDARAASPVGPGAEANLDTSLPIKYKWSR
jgi:hypothetical protein